MLMLGSKLLDFPVLSLQIGGPIARTLRAIIDPEELQVIGYTVDGPLVDKDENGTILDTRDVRELASAGFIVDSIDVLVNREDVIKLDQTMGLNFDLIGLKVVTEKGKRIGRVVDYTVDENTLMVYQLIVKRPAISSLIDPQLTINRSQITEIDDFTVTIRHDKEEVKVESHQKEEPEDFVPNFVNPFRKGATEEDYSDIDDSSSTMSE